MTSTNTSRKVGLALGSGAARGCAHLGVIDALNEAGVPIDVVAGTSIGSLVGGVYANGRLEALRETLLQIEWKEILYYFFDFSVPRGGLIDGKRIAEFIHEFVADAELGDLAVPFRAVATDILSGREVVLSDGRLIEAIRASIAVPGIFTPVTRGESALVDGGLVNPVPVSTTRDMGADFVIAVDINSNRVGPGSSPPPEDDPADQHQEIMPPPLAWRQRIADSLGRRLDKVDAKMKAQLHRWTRSDQGPNLFDVLGNSIRIMEAQITETMLAVNPPDVLIRPQVGHINFLDFHQAQDAIRAGYEAAQDALVDVPEDLRN